MFLRALNPVPPRWQRLAAVILLALYLPSAGLAFAYAAQSPSSHRLVVYAVDRHHHVLPSGSTLRPGQQVTIYARGFARTGRVQVVDVNRRAITFVVADRSGTAHAGFRVPAHVVPHRRKVVAMDGLIGRATTPAPARSTVRAHRRDPQPIEVSVPLLRQFTYRVGGGAGVDSGHTGHGGDGGHGGLSNTGFDVLALLAAAILLLLLGTFLVISSRRRHE